MLVEGVYVLVTVLMLYYHIGSASDCNGLRIVCIDVCTNDVSLMNIEQSIWDYTVQAARVQVIV